MIYTKHDRYFQNNNILYLPVIFSRMNEILAYQQQLFNVEKLINHFMVKRRIIRIILMRKAQFHRKSNNVQFVKTKVNLINIFLFEMAFPDITD